MSYKNDRQIRMVDQRTTWNIRKLCFPVYLVQWLTTKSLNQSHVTTTKQYTLFLFELLVWNTEEFCVNTHSNPLSKNCLNVIGYDWINSCFFAFTLIGHCEHLTAMIWEMDFRLVRVSVIFTELVSRLIQSILCDVLMLSLCHSVCWSSSWTPSFPVD